MDTVDKEKIKNEIVDKLMEKVEGKFLTMEEAQKMIASLKQESIDKGEDFYTSVAKSLVAGNRVIKAGESLAGVTPGSGLIKTSVAKKIYTLEDEYAFIMKEATVIPSPDMKVSIGYEVEGDDGAFVDVGTAVTTSDQTVNIMNFNAHRWSKGQYVDKKLIEHATSDVVQWLFAIYGKAFHKKVYRKMITGTGNGEPYGLNTYTVPEVDFSATSGIDYETVSDAFLTLPRIYREQAMWIGSSDFVKKVYTLKDSVGKPLFNVEAGTIFGRPVYEHPDLASGATAGDIVAYFIYLPAYFILIADQAELSVVEKDVSTVSRGQNYVQLDLYVDGMLASTELAVKIVAQ